MTKVQKLDSAALVVEGLGLGHMLRRAGAWRGLYVLNYHRIGEHARSKYDRGVYSATPEDFDTQVQFLMEHFEVIGPDQVSEAIRRPTGRKILITFDDGYRDNYEYAFPILKRHGASAIFFVTTGYLDQPRLSWWDEIAWMVRQSPLPVLPASEWVPDALKLTGEYQEAAIATLQSLFKALPGGTTKAFMQYLRTIMDAGCPGHQDINTMWMTWDMVREMHAAGMGIGGHTVTHPVLANLPMSEQFAEIASCKERIEAETGVPMTLFAYPNGTRDDFDNTTRYCLRQNGVEHAFTLYGDYLRAPAADPYDIPRVWVTWYNSPRVFRAKLTLPMLFGWTTMAEFRRAALGVVRRLHGPNGNQQQLRHIERQWR